MIGKTLAKTETVGDYGAKLVLGEGIDIAGEVIKAGINKRKENECIRNRDTIIALEIENRTREIREQGRNEFAILLDGVEDDYEKELARVAAKYETRLVRKENPAPEVYCPLGRAVYIRAIHRKLSNSSNPGDKRGGKRPHHNRPGA